MCVWQVALALNRKSVEAAFMKVLKDGKTVREQEFDVSLLALYSDTKTSARLHTSVRPPPASHNAHTGTRAPKHPHTHPHTPACARHVGGCSPASCWCGGGAGASEGAGGAEAGQLAVPQQPTAHSDVQLVEL